MVIGGSEKMMRLKQVAERLGVSLRTVYREIQEGRLPQPMKVRACSVIPESVIDAYLRRMSPGDRRCESR